MAQALTVGLVLTAVVIAAAVLELVMVAAQDQREALQTEAVVMARDQPEVQAMEMAQVMAAVMALLVVPQAEALTVGLEQMVLAQTVAQALTAVVIAAAVLELAMVTDQATVEMAVTMALSLTLLM